MYFLKLTIKSLRKISSPRGWKNWHIDKKFQKIEKNGKFFQKMLQNHIAKMMKTIPLTQQIMQ